MLKQALAEKLHKTIIRKIKKQKIVPIFSENIWGADLAYMQLISKFDKGICFLLCVIDVYSKCTRFFPLKDTKGTTITF